MPEQSTDKTREWLEAREQLKSRLLTDEEIAHDLKQIKQEYGLIPKDKQYYLNETAGEIQQRAQRTKDNIANRSNFTRGLVSGIDNMQGMAYGLVGLGANAVGLDSVKDWGYKNMLRNEEEASENPTDVQEFFSTDKDKGAFGSVSNMGKWASGELGSLMPSVAEGFLSGIAGSLIASQAVPGVGADDVVAVPAGGIAGFFAKNAIKRYARKLALKEGISVSTAKKMLTPQLKKQIYRNAVKQAGATAGVVASTGGLEAGSNWGELKKSEIEAPVSSLFMGLASGASEAFLGNAPLAMRAFFKSPIAKTFKKEAKKRGVRVAAGWLWDLMKNGGEEAGQEAFQEILSSLNQEINDPAFKITDKETFKQWMEAGASGAIGGLGFGAALAPKKIYDHISSPQIEDIDNDMDNAVTASPLLLPEGQAVSNQEYKVPQETVDIAAKPVIEDVDIPGPGDISIPTLNLDTYFVNYRPTESQPLLSAAESPTEQLPEFNNGQVQLPESILNDPQQEQAVDDLLQVGAEPEQLQSPEPIVEDNKYLSMPIDVVQKHAEMGVNRAKDALDARREEIALAEKTEQSPVVEENLADKLTPAQKDPAENYKQSPISKALTTDMQEHDKHPRVAFKVEAGKKYPNAVLFDVRDYNSKSVGVFGVSYDGTKEDAVKANETFRGSLEYVLGGNAWSNIETRTGATGEDGSAQWTIISSNGKVIKDVRVHKQPEPRTQAKPEVEKKSESEKWKSSFLHARSYALKLGLPRDQVVMDKSGNRITHEDLIRNIKNFHAENTQTRGKNENSTKSNKGDRQSNQQKRQTVSTAGTSKRGSSALVSTEAVSTGARNENKDNSAVSADHSGHERTTGSGLQGNEVSTPAVGMEEQRPTGDSGADLRQPAGSNKVVSTSPAVNTATAARPDNDRFNFDLRSKSPVQLTKSERKRINRDVKEILQKDRFDSNDLNLLHQYTGEGGLSSGTKEALNQHYTDYNTIRAIFRAIDASGYKYRKALEPAVGAGSFLGNKPDAKWTTIDIDPTNHAVTKALYPQGKHYLISFENYKEGGHDLIVSNVPFLESRGVPKVRKDIKALHDFYFVHALDLVKENGIVAFITSSGTMDKKSSKIREEIVSKADIIGAYRLPGGHFEKGAHTSVVTDIIFMQKRPAGVPAGMKQRILNNRFVESSETEDGIPLNMYYQRKKENILGELVAGVNKMYGKPAYEIKGKADLTRIKIDYKKYKTGERQKKSADAAPANGKEIPTNSHEFDKWADDNKVFTQRDVTIAGSSGNEYQNRDPQFNRGLIVQPDGTVLEACATVDFSDINGKGKVYQELTRHADKILMLDKINKLALEFQKDKDRKYADQAIDFIGQYESKFNKAPHKDFLLRAVFSRNDEQSYYAELTALFDENFIPADVFREQTRHINSGVASVNSDSPVRDRALVCEDSRGVVDIDKSNLLSRNDIPQLIHNGYSIVDYNKKSAVLQNDVLYFSGNVYDKISKAKAVSDSRTDIKSKIESQIERLESIKPEPRALDEIHVNFNESWILPLLNEAGFTYISSEVDSKTGQKVFKTRDKDKIFENHLNNRALIARKSKDGWQEPINSYMARLREAEAEVNEVIIKIKQRIKAIPNLEEKVAYAYNSRYRGYVKPDYDKARYLIQDVLDEIKESGIELRKNQVSWIIQAAYEGIGINGHDVGGGKTFAAIALARVLKKKGIANKPLFVVPAKTIPNWDREIRILFPDAKIVNLGNLSADRRTKELFALSNTNADYVLISHEGFKQIKLPLKEELKYVDDVLHEHIDDPEASNRQRGLIEQKMDAYKDILTNDKRNSRLTFDKLGVDAVIADEAHNFKNIGIHNKLNKFGLGAAFGLNQSEKTGDISLKSARSYDFRFKTNYITDNNNGKNVFLLSATPTPNKPMEVYTMLRHLNKNIFHEFGIYTDRDFANTFMKLGAVKGGNGKQKSILKAIVNAIDFRGILNRYVDKLSMEQMPWIKVPEANVMDHYFDQSESYQIIAEDMSERQSRISTGTPPAKGEDTLISIYTGGRNASVDPRLYGGEHAGESIGERSFNREDDKMQFTVEEVSKVAESNKQSGQLIFLDAAGHTQAKNGTLAENLHKELKKELVSRGLKSEEVAIINGQEITNAETGKETGSGNKEERKQAIVEAYNAGQIRVVIGTTTSMGEGMNLQVPTTDIWHMDIPYTPGAIRQRNGRGVRYRNRNEKVNIHMMFMRGSFDTTSFELVSAKRGWNEAIWDKEVADTIDTTEEFAEGSMPPAIKMRIELESDPVKKKALELEYQYTTLLNDRENSSSLIWSLKNRISKTKHSLEQNRERLQSRQSKLSGLKPDAKIKNSKKRQNVFEDKQKNLKHLIVISERNIESDKNKLERIESQLTEAVTESDNIQQQIKDFEAEYFDDDGNIVTEKIDSGADDDVKAHDPNVHNRSFQYEDLKGGNKFKALRLVKKITGSCDVQFARKIFNSKGESVFGRYREAFIDIATGKGNVEDTARHEALHYAYDLLLTVREAQLFDDAAKAQGLSHEQAIEGINRFAADGKGIRGKLKLIALRLFRRIRMLFGKERAIDQLNEIYDNALSGKYAKRGATGNSNYGSNMVVYAAAKHKDTSLNNANNGKAVRHSDVPVNPEIFVKAGIKSEKIYADYDYLYSKHPEYFNSLEDVKKTVEFVLNKPDHIIQGTAKNNIALDRKADNINRVY